MIKVTMQTIILLPALAAVCFGAAIPNPQEWGSPTTLSVRPIPSYTIVVPCFPGIPDCVPQTLTYPGTNTAATAVAREAAPQELGSPSRTVLLPTPPPVSTTKKSSSSTKKPIPTTKPPTPPPVPTTKKSSSTKKPVTTTKKTHYIRQELGSPSRTVLLPTYPPPPPPKPTTTKKPSVSSKKPTSTSKKSSSSTRKTHYGRQELGSPTRTDLIPVPTSTTYPKPTTSTKKPPPHLPTYSGPWWGPGPIVTIVSYI